MDRLSGTQRRLLLTNASETDEKVAAAFSDRDFVEYSEQSQVTMTTLSIAFERFGADEAFEPFCAREDWLTDYAVFMSLKDENGQRPWYEWEESLRMHDPEALKAYIETHKSSVRFWEFVQYTFFSQ